MSGLYLWLIFLCLFTNMSTLPTHVNETVDIDPEKGSNSNTINGGEGQFGPCLLAWTDTSYRDDMRAFLSDDAKLIEITLTFDNEAKRKSFGHMLKPQHWSLTTGRHGKGLLMLHYNYEMLSLTALSVGVETITAPVKQNPPGCLWKLNATDVENNIRDLLLNENTGSQLCNMQIMNMNGQADFEYMCCDKGPGNETMCEELQTEKWINVLLVCIVVIKVLVVLYSPLLVPDSWYRLSYVASEYHYNCQQPQKITVFKTMNPEYYPTIRTKAKVSKFREMPEFLKILDRMKTDTNYSIAMETATIRVKYRRLVPENYVPVSVGKSLYNSLFRCKIRQQPDLKSCCESKVLGALFSFSWVQCLKALMQVTLFICLAIPWIIRIAVFFWYEDDEIYLREDAAKSQGLKVPFPGNVTLYLTPIHGLFVLIYLIIFIDSVLFGVLRKQVQNRFKYVLRKCFRDMKERSRYEILGWAIGNLLKPMEKYGLVGIIVGIPFWAIAIPVCGVIMAFYMFPTLNLSVRLLAHFVAYLIPQETQCTKNRMFQRMREMADNSLNMRKITNQESIERSEATSLRGRLLQLLIIAICLISLYSIIFLLMECISFFVEIGIYTMMGVILNAGKTMKFVTLLLLLVFYGNDCFKSVHRKYLDFNKVINKEICSKVGDKLRSTALKNEDVQNNSVFYIKAEGTEDDKRILQFYMKDKIPKWKANQLILFLDNQDAPYIPEKFFFNTCYLPYFGCPGHLYVNLIQAMSQFMIIVLFLLFVVVVVLAFGDVYRVSATNQMMATLAGGFLPWIFRHVLFKTPPGLALDTSDLSFQNHFNQVIRNFQQSWPIADIVSDNVEDMGERQEMNTANRGAMSDNQDAIETEPLVRREEQTDSTRSDAASNDVDLMVILPNTDTPDVGLNGSLSMLAESEIDWQPGNYSHDEERFPQIINV